MLTRGRSVVLHRINVATRMRTRAGLCHSVVEQGGLCGVDPVALKTCCGMEGSTRRYAGSSAGSAAAVATTGERDTSANEFRYTGASVEDVFSTEENTTAYSTSSTRNANRKRFAGRNDSGIPWGAEDLGEATGTVIRTGKQFGYIRIDEGVKPKDGEGDDFLQAKEVHFRMRECIDHWVLPNDKVTFRRFFLSKKRKVIVAEVRGGSGNVKPERGSYGNKMKHGDSGSSAPQHRAFPVASEDAGVLASNHATLGEGSGSSQQQISELVHLMKKQQAQLEEMKEDLRRISVEVVEK
ncbi:unnamed protein product [Amoebophrya sp. A120]|nr:unnamed protein product [Amoebophrya sp. A120]|eukprot:GSA120T00022010001.1